MKNNKNISNKIKKKYINATKKNSKNQIKVMQKKKIKNIKNIY